MTGPSSRDEELHDLLSALLDGELTADEEAEVRAYVERTPAAQVDLEALARVRHQLRDLPAVDPPFGFYESMLRRRGPRRGGPSAVSALLAAAAAIVVLIGLTPVADRVVPPVNAYAERHMHMMTPPAPGTTGGSSVGAAGSVPATGGSGSTTTTVPAPPRTDAIGSFVSVAAPTLDRMGAPAEVAGSFHRMGGYESSAGVVHLMYSNGAREISIYEEPGTVAWEGLPAAGARLQLEDGAPAWAMHSDREEVLVVERDAVVYTVVATGGHDEMVAVVEGMPDPPAPSLADRFHHACRSVVEHFGFDQ